MDNAKQLHNGLHDLGLEVGPHISPVVSVALDEPEVAVRFWSALVEGGIYLNLALPPATPSSRPLLRASVSAAHSPATGEAASREGACQYVQISVVALSLKKKKPIKQT